MPRWAASVEACVPHEMEIQHHGHGFVGGDGTCSRTNLRMDAGGKALHSLRRVSKMPPLKPEVCIVGDRLAVFMGADYKLMELAAADKWVRKLQGELAKLKRQDKRHKRLLGVAHASNAAKG